MYMTNVDNAVRNRFAELRAKGVEVDEDLAAWDNALHNLRHVFADNEYPDLYLHKHWKTPIELGFVHQYADAYYSNAKSLPPSIRHSALIPWETIRPYIEPLDAILLHLAMFTGDQHAKKT